MKPIPSITTHRRSMSNCAKIIREHLVAGGYSIEGLESFGPHTASVSAFFQALNKNLGIDLGSPGYYIKDINKALIPLREMFPGGGTPSPLDPPLFDGTIPDMALEPGVQMSPYDASAHFQTGGVVDTYSLTGTPAPLDLVIDSVTGIISGIPATVGSTSGITVTGTNANGSAVSNEITVTVAVPVDPPVFSGEIPNQNATVGTPFTYDAGQHFTGATSYSLIDNLAWMTVDAAGMLGGTPTDVATNLGTQVQGTNTGGSQTSNHFDVTVVAAPPVMPPMIISVNTEIVTPGELTMELPLEGTHTVDIDWGDGVIDTGLTALLPVHTYATPGIYQISISGTADNFSFGAGAAIDAGKLIDIMQWGDLGITDWTQAFKDCINLISISASDAPIGLISADNMFSSCANLITPPDTSGWDMSSATSIKAMFYTCHALTTPPDTSTWVTTALTDMSFMFQDCMVLASYPDVSGWDTSSVTTMSFTFKGCVNVVTPPAIAGWNVSNVTDISYMFSGCSALTGLDVSGWDISNITTGEQFLFNSTNALDATSYAALLAAWSVQTVQPGVPINFGSGADYAPGSQAEADKAILTAAPNSWLIIDNVTPYPV